MVRIDPTSKKDQHCKIYVEPELKKAIDKFQVQQKFSSFSEAGRALLIYALNVYGM